MPRLVFSPTLAACEPAEAPAPQWLVEPAGEQETAPRLSSPGAIKFRSAWAEQCNANESEVGSALCKAEALAVGNVSCDFALGDDEHRHHSEEIERSGDRWVLADPDKACDVAQQG